MSDRKPPDGLLSDRELYTVPARSSWFLWDEIHDTERSELPEFFDGTSFSRNPRVYKEYRDFVISRYREDPTRRLTFTEVRRSLVGDAGALRRVFLFLDRWGLINFSAAEVGRVQAEEGADGTGGVFSVLVEDAPPSGVKVVPFPNAAKEVSLQAQPQGIKMVTEEAGTFRLPPLTSYSDVFGAGIPVAGQLCESCGEACISGRYESKSGVVSCTRCFENKNHGIANSSNDFKFNDQKIDGGKQMASEWTDAEKLHLLEAIVSKGPDWDLIANHVRRSRLECISKFIQLPFGEHMLGSIGVKCEQRNLASEMIEESIQSTNLNLDQDIAKPDMQSIGNALENEQVDDVSKTEPPWKKRCLSLADASDSLIEKVASMSTLVGTYVAAVAAEAAVSALCDEHPFAKKVFMAVEDVKDGKAFSSALMAASDLKTEEETQENFKELEYTAESNFGHLTLQIRAATATAFGAAAAQSKLLAEQEERQIEYLMSSILDMQLRKIRYKMKHLADLESILEHQYAQLQQLKEDILQEWIDVSQLALAAGIPRWKDHNLHKPLANKYLVE